MATGIVLDPRYMAHDPGRGHPERPERIGVLLPALLEPPDLQRVEPRLATAEEITLVHRAGHFDHVAQTRGVGHYAFDADTPACADSFDTACLAVGGLLALLDEVVAGRLDNGFAVVRPPGHHAEPDRAMGFCLFNNVAIGAAYLRARYGLERVLVVDWDVHHGNGTQHVFEADRDVLFASLHQFPFYPGTGALDEQGHDRGLGATVNLPLPAGCGDAEYGLLFDSLLAPLLSAFKPEIILVSAGFDAHARDPLGGMRVSTAGFGLFAQRLCAVADDVCGGRIALALEGGYDLEALADSVGEVVRVLAQPSP
ncbi:MAG: histone deacetylase family protein, partial [Myxococcota bacterium]